jgi:S-adenosylmethionine synthetase
MSEVKPAFLMLEERDFFYHLKPQAGTVTRPTSSRRCGMPKQFIESEMGGILPGGRKRMIKHDFVFTSESVAEGHPDKVCDQMSDAVVDAILESAEEPRMARAAIECLATTQHLTLAGEYRSNGGGTIDVEDIVRQVIGDIGYDKPEWGFDPVNCEIVSKLHLQSADISNMGDDGGAGDQGLMFGYAVDETPELMPLPVVLAHRLVERMDRVRKERVLGYLIPDGKSQVTVRYEGGKPVGVEKVVLAVPHEEGIKKDKLREDLYREVVTPVLDKYGYECVCRLDGTDTNFLVNGTGDWFASGPASDTGLTGRKVIVDTYGGMARHGGGCFSGKDPSKVDRSASYMARYVAKNIVRAGLAGKCEIQLAYVIGVKEPVSVMVETFGTGVVSDGELEKAVREIFDLTPRGIIRQLDLLRPIFRKTACYGHFGRELEEFSWEKTDRVAELKEYFGR